MLTLSREQWVKTLVFFAFSTLILAIIHEVDDIIHEDLPEATILFFAAVGTLSLFGIFFWNWAGKLYGYIIVGLYGLFYVVIFNVLHLFGILDVSEYSEIGQSTPEGWAPAFVATGLFGGITSVATVIIAVYLLIKARQSS